MWKNGVFVCLVLAACMVCAGGVKRRYDGDKVLAIGVKDAAEWKAVRRILHKYIPVEDQDVWKEPTKSRPGYVRVPHAYCSDVLQSLTEANIYFAVVSNDIQRLISRSEAEMSEIRRLRSGSSKDIVGTFPRYDEVITWMENITDTYPEIASTFSIGNTYEGRPMQVLKLGQTGSNKWNVWLDAGVHAREWLAPSTAIYVTDQLLQGWDNHDPEIRDFLEKLDFHILPVANPDGYEYTHTTDRLWRKNRMPNDNSSCIGIDLNRNFDFQWGVVDPTTDPCENTFMGPSAESEREVQNIVNYILPLASSFIWYHSYHTWGELFFTRWDYTADEVPPDHQELLALAESAVDAINSVHDEYYQAGTSPELMYAFSGSSSDWSRGVAQIKYPYLQELRDANGTYGFEAPPSEIIPCGEENWQGYLVILRDIILNYGDVPPPLSDALAALEKQKMK